MPEKKVLIIVPAFNEENAILKTLSAIQSACPGYAIVVINDGSSDGTSDIARKNGIPVIDLPYNLGIGGAMQCGFRYASLGNFDIAVQIDGDGQHDPGQIQSILDPVSRGEAELCIGSRFLRPNPGFRSTFTRRIGIHYFSKLLYFVTGERVTDPTSGFRAYGRRLIEKFAHDYPVDFPEPEAIIMAKWQHAKIMEVSVQMRERQGGISSIRSLMTFYYMVKVTLAILIDTLKKRT